ncbi:MAG: nucleoside triphosphate pyrophosphohydrolase family protein [Candidatus Saccharibacteria bacterium]|nr:nucleoside triphosphate pyrophosphohydrolase family protein [Candidatus Saccharibacteria bacterium]
MEFDEYQKQAQTTDLGFKNMGEVMTKKTLNIPEFLDKVLGLVGESGEFADKVKKIMRDKRGVFSEEERMEILKELGDVLWYVAELSSYLDIPMSELAKMNLDKLASRKKRGTLVGAGDNR